MNINPEILKTVGQVAGIGGLALGIFLILFREVIRKNIFSDLTKEQSYTLLRMIIILVWSIAIAGLLAWIYVETKIKHKASADLETPTVVFQDIPNIRTMYLSLEGTTLLNRALRGIGFSEQDGFSHKPFWLKNQVFNDMQSILTLCNQQVLSEDKYDYTEMTWYARSSKGKELWHVGINDGRVVERSALSGKRDNAPKDPYTGAYAIRGPNFVQDTINIDEVFRLVQTSDSWNINVNSITDTIGFDAYEIFGLPEAHESLRYITKDVLSKQVIQATPSARDVVVLTVSFAHDGYNGMIWIRELKMLVLDIENTGDKPIGLSTLKQQIFRPTNLYQARTAQDNARAVKASETEDYPLPLEMLKPKEHLFIPLNLQLSYASSLKEEIDWNFERYIQRNMLPKQWWKARSEEDFSFQIIRSTDSNGNPITNTLNISKALFASKPSFSSMTQSAYFIGHSIDAKRIILKTGAGTETPWDIRRFNPDNLIARGAYSIGSCPILSFKMRGETDWRRSGPVLINSVTRSRERMINLPLSMETSEIKLSEEEPETTYIDAVYLKLLSDKGRHFTVPLGNDPLIKARDGKYLTLKRGDELILSLKGVKTGEVIVKRDLVIVGYYVPDKLAKDGALSR